MAQLQKFIKVTQEQYDILKAGGTVGSYTGIDPSYIYLVESNETSGNCLFEVGEGENSAVLAASGNTASGTSAVANGFETSAAGIGSHTEGESTRTEADWAHAEGYNTRAAGDASHAEGYSTQATDTGSHAEGELTKAMHVNAHAEGYSTTASGESSHAEGWLTNAEGNQSHAEGTATKANGENSHAEGSSTTASGENSHAEGSSTTASGQYSHAEGYAATASGASSHAEGFGYYIDSSFTSGSSINTPISSLSVSITANSTGSTSSQGIIFDSLPKVSIGYSRLPTQSNKAIDSFMEITNTSRNVVAVRKVVNVTTSGIFTIYTLESALPGDWNSSFAYSIKMYSPGAEGNISHTEGICNSALEVASHA